jgi:ABC-2 type transport system permease protein
MGGQAGNATPRDGEIGGPDRGRRVARSTPGEKLERIGQIVRKELLESFRDFRLRGLLFIAPIVQLLIFGYAVSTDIRHTSTFVVDHDKTRVSRELVDVLTASGYFRVVGLSDRPTDLADALDHGRAVVGIEIPPGFARDVARGSGAGIQMLVDGTNSNVASIALGYAERIFQSYGTKLATVRPAGGIDLRERAWFNPNLASRNYNVPAVVGMIILLTTMLLTALAVVREREIGTLEQLRVSPLTSGELIMGKTIPFALTGLMELIIVTTVALVWFRVPFEGNVLLLLLASFLYLLPALGMGLFISTLANTQQEAFMVNFLVMMPTILLSGFMFPVSSMPVAFQWLTLLNPVRHYLFVVRAIFLKGAGFGALWPQLLALLGMGIAILVISARRLRTTRG